MLLLATAILGGFLVHWNGVDAGSGGETAAFTTRRRSSSSSSSWTHPYRSQEGLSSQPRQQATRREQGNGEDYDVVVIGAGWAGLGAARTLFDTQSISVLVLEGRNYVGGRSRTVSFSDGTPVELGSGWVHGASSANVIYQVVQESGMGIVASSDSVSYWSNAYHDDSPHLVNLDDVEPLVESLTDGFHEFLDNYPDDDNGKDMPLESAAQEYEQQENMTDDAELVFDLALDSSIVAEYAASLQDLSRWYWDADAEPIAGGDALIGKQGYSGAVQWYASDLQNNIRLGANVTSIDWSDPAKVSITYVSNGTAPAQTVTAQRVIVTVPIGVLKRRSVSFTPDLPQAKWDAIDRLGMGLLNKCIMKWSQNATLPWPTDRGWMERIAPPGEQGRWTEFFSLEGNTKQKVVIAWSAGREADRVELLDDDEIKAEVMEAFAAMFGDGAVPTPQEWIMSRWRADPWSRGSYSYHAVGSGPDDRKELAKPVDDRLFFAGEATHQTYMSTTHGALSSGITAGSMVRESLAASTPSTSSTATTAYAATITMTSILWFAVS